MSEIARSLPHRSSPSKCALKARAANVVLALLLSLTLGACATDRFAQRPPAWGDTLHDASQPMQLAEPAQPAQAEAAATADAAPSRSDPGFYRPGSGVMVRPAPTIADARPQDDGDVKLNFQNANLLEVVKVVLGDMLGISYTVDPTVQGTVSMQTSGALRRDDLIPTLELLLRMNNAALITSQGVYRIVPLANAMAEARAPQLGDSTLALPGGFSVRVVPLRYVAAEEMAQILEPFVSGSNQLLRVDSTRNLLIMAGNASDMDRLLDTVAVFDVDRMAGMSVALFTPEFVDASTLAGDLEALLADPQQGLMAGLVRLIVVERLNGIMVVTPRAEHLARVREWIQRLDRDTGDADPRLFIYRVQNGKATDLAEVLSQLFGAGSSEAVPAAELAPGLTPKTIGQRAPATVRKTLPAATDGDAPAAAAVAQRSTSPPAPSGETGGINIGRAERVQVIADEPNNALLILARGGQYRQILTALKQLDVSPMQVLIEVTIAEVTLSDNLSYGVEWFFKNNFGSRTGEGLLDLGAESIGALVPGFSYALKAPDVRFVLNALASESNLSIISSPSLLVLNNQEASINVGEEVPLITQQATSTAVATDPLEPSLVLTSTVEYRDTGVLLNVKPRVNAGGLVIMEVEQEVSQATSTADADPLTPRIRQRKISSTVAVNSGDTIILGGLIQENRDLSESGIPWFYKLPVVGALFGTKADNQDRTELIVLITPRAISSGTAALQVTEEYRRRLKKLIPSRSGGGAVGNVTDLPQRQQQLTEELRDADTRPVAELHKKRAELVAESAAQLRLARPEQGSFAPAMPPVVATGGPVQPPGGDANAPAATAIMATTLSQPLAVAPSATPEAPAAKSAAGVEEFVSEWAAAWSRQDVDAYLSSYAADFQPPDGVTRAAWATKRRQRVTQPKVISVEVIGLEVAALDGQRATVTFEQAYRANHYRARASKRLDLQLQDGNWKIMREIIHD